ncbi:uncharacterized protein LOC144301974 isoform X2 [Canis aureus]
MHHYPQGLMLPLPPRGVLEPRPLTGFRNLTTDAHLESLRTEVPGQGGGGEGLHLSLPRTRSTSFLQHSPTSLALMQPGKDGLLTCLLREKVLQNQQGQDPGVQSI